jgi:arginine decarboxylase
VFTQEILSFMRSLDTPEIHGYRPDLGYRVYADKALEIAAATRPAPPAEGNPGPPEGNPAPPPGEKPPSARRPRG